MIGSEVREMWSAGLQMPGLNNPCVAELTQKGWGMFSKKNCGFVNNLIDNHDFRYRDYNKSPL